MIIVTTSAQHLVKKFLPKNTEVTTMKVKDFADRLTLIDPSLNDGTGVAFIMMVSDYTKGGKKGNIIVGALANKHPENIVVVIDPNKKPNATVSSDPNINEYIQKPSGAEFMDLITAIQTKAYTVPQRTIAAVSNELGRSSTEITGVQSEYVPDKEPIISSDQLPPDLQPREPANQTQQGLEMPQPSFDVPPVGTTPSIANPWESSQPMQQGQSSQPGLDLTSNQQNDAGMVPQFQEQIYSAAPQVSESDMLTERIRSAGRVSDVSAILNEMTAQQLVKDMIKDHSIYESLEQELDLIQIKITETLMNKTISVSEQIEQIQSLLRDRSTASTRRNSMLYKRFEDIINIVLDKTKSIIAEEIKALDEIAYESKKEKASFGNGRLRGITEERSNKLLHLRTLEQELTDSFTALDKIASDLQVDIATTETNTTHYPQLDDKLKISGRTFVSEETMKILSSIFEIIKPKLNSEYSEMISKVKVYMDLLKNLFELDKEQIATQERIIEYLQSNKLMDTVVAGSFLQKSMRIYITQEGDGSTIVPYLISREQSCANCNTLLINLTGRSRHEDYGIQSLEITKLFSDKPKGEFYAFHTKNVPDIKQMPIFVDFLTKSMAAHYRVINIVLDVNDVDLIKSLEGEFLAQTFIVASNHVSISKMKDAIENLKIENVAQRVLINKSSAPLDAVIHELGLTNRQDYTLGVFPYFNAISEASFTKFDPFMSNGVRPTLRNLVKG